LFSSWEQLEIVINACINIFRYNFKVSHRRHINSAAHVWIFRWNIYNPAEYKLCIPSPSGTLHIAAKLKAKQNILILFIISQ
jgi:hypothetical protein